MSGLGEYFLNSLYSDIDSLLLYRNPSVNFRFFTELCRRDFLSRFFIVLSATRS